MADETKISNSYKVTLLLIGDYAVVTGRWEVVKKKTKVKYASK